MTAENAERAGPDAGPDAETATYPDVPAPQKPPSSRRGLVIGIVVAIAAVAVIAVSAAVAWRLLAGASTPAVGSAAGPQAVVASIQARTVATLIGAWVADDRAAIENLVTAESLPWTAAPPPLPPNVPRALVGAVAKPRLEGDTWVIGDASVAMVRLTGDGRTPQGTVTAQLIVPGAAPREFTVGLIMEGGTWRVATLNGQPVGAGLEGLLK